MGENEQGGMLRTVVVLGVIAIIAAAVIGAMIALRGHMSEKSSNVAQQVNKAVHKDDVDKSMRDASDIATKKSNILVQNTEIASEYAKQGKDKYNIQGDTKFGNAGRIGVDDQGKASIDFYGNGTAYTPIVDIPDGAKTVTIKMRAKTSNYIGFYANTNGSAQSAYRYPSWWGADASQLMWASDKGSAGSLCGFRNWKNASFTIDLKEKNGGYDTKNRKISLWIQNGNYAKSDTPSDSVSQISYSFAD